MSRIRVRTVCPRLQGVRPRGQDVLVELVRDDGSAEVIPDVCAVHVTVPGRADYVKAVLVVCGVELDLEAHVEDSVHHPPLSEPRGFLGEARDRKPSA